MLECSKGITNTETNLGSWLLALGSWLLALGSWLLALGSWLLALGSWLLALLGWLTSSPSNSFVRRKRIDVLFEKSAHVAHHFMVARLFFFLHSVIVFRWKTFFEGGLEMVSKLLFLSGSANIILMFLAFPMPKGNLKRGLWKLWRWNLLAGVILAGLYVYQGGGNNL